MKQVLREGDDYTGFVAMGFVSPEGNPISVFRGSEPLHGKFNEDQSDDWVDNLYNMLLGKESSQYAQAEAFYKKMNEEGSGRPIVVGHSKAGNLAAYLAAKFGYMDAHLYNPMPLHNNWVNEENLKSSNVYTHVAENDFIATLLSLIEPGEIETLLSELSEEEFVMLLSLDKESIAQLVTSHPDVFAGILSRLSEGAITKKEAQLILESLTEEELLKLMNGDDVAKIMLGLLFEHRKDLGDVINRLVFEEKWKDIRDRLADFEGNFTRFKDNNKMYTYPGKVQIHNNDSKIWNMIDSHGTHNFYQTYYSTIKLNFSETRKLIQQLDSINSRLSNIDSDLNVLLGKLLLDLNPLDTFQNLINGGSTILADLKIEKSRTVSNCSKWLQTVETEFLNKERSLVQQAGKLGGWR
ncbi:DUF6792 domain-containing protein [Sutcliffiella halmapala]